MFASFRKSRSYQYHVTAEERSLYRENPSIYRIINMLLLLILIFYLIILIIS